jgi:dihydroneopterin aldolase
MNDRIVLKGVRAFGYHGVLPHERTDGQEFIVDVEVTTNFDVCAASDDVNDTVNYAQLAQIAHDAIVGPAFDLIEKLADVIATNCMQIDGVKAVSVTVHKPSAPIEVPFDNVSVVRCLP